ncbi:MAG: hypothetical protein D6702_03585, partial [Planctomycetota bacterium]
EFDPELPLRVALIDIQVIPDGAGQTLRNFETEALIEAAPTGEFVFEGVFPGEKEVTVLQQTAPGEWVFSFASFQLGPGESRDLGTFSPVPETLTLVVGLRDETGARLDPNDPSLWREEPAETRCDVLIKQEADGLLHPIWEWVQADLGQVIRFQGFPVGRWSVQAMPLRGWPSALRGWSLPRNEAYVEGFSDRLLRVDFVLRRTG